MRWVGPNASHGRNVREHGAVAVIVSVLVAAGVVMGSLAISVDIGQIMSERRQLQNGADAAAMALAAMCAESGNASCAADSASSYNPAATAVKPLANFNAKDGLSSIASICAANVAGFTDTCAPAAADAGNLGKCNPLPTGFNAAIKYVEVRTRTQTSSGSTVLTPFAQALVGGGSSGTTVSSCARAAWGPPSSTGNTLPLVVGNCEWLKMTANGTKYAPGPPYSPAPGTSTTLLPTVIKTGGYVVGIQAHADANNVDPACRKANGEYYPGGFGWLSETDCVASIAADATVNGETGAAVPNGCKTASNLNQWVGREVFIPIAISDTGSGTSGVYQLDGVASFFLAGYSSLPSGGTYAVYKDELNVCSSKCIWGWFTSGLLPVGSSVGTGTSKGSNIVVPVG
ncbi:hypothetical protein GCM10009721_41820 [Terrabacter tumescens]|uniref:Putative Flp pilus-assembly TadG-like N-terminal domain-containing protein n=1 Tax=Terrabacter tumescens TaxID=60443 RepID=A0ABQ2IKJ1_9MICO|nr:pilus assembly protein TadG-related protein [Terrabacter tumescens]GGN09560.1 hypothetical protein GCM10009721_41820 [Terrabacter tumescens]